MEEGAASQGIWAASGSWQRQESGLSLRVFQKDHSPADTSLFLFYPIPHHPVNGAHGPESSLVSGLEDLESNPGSASNLLFDPEESFYLSGPQFSEI